MVTVRMSRKDAMSLISALEDAVRTGLPESVAYSLAELDIRIAQALTTDRVRGMARVAEDYGKADKDLERWENELGQGGGEQ